MGVNVIYKKVNFINEVHIFIDKVFLQVKRHEALRMQAHVKCPLS